MNPAADTHSPPAGPGLALLAGTLFLLSGGTAVAYEVLWLRQLAALFGGTAVSAATCLAVFFTGMALGQSVAVGRCSALSRPLWAYGALEVMTALASLGALGLPALHAGLDPWFAAPGSFAGASVAGRLILAALILGPPSVCLGATYPVLVEALVRRSGTLARTATGLYAANTFGGVLGALACGFWLLPNAGFRASYLAVVALNLLLGLAALALAARGESPPPRPARPRTSGLRWPPAPLLVAAFASGALALGMEVVWTRMLVQVLHNSVYTFAVVLAVMLLALSAGGVLVHLLTRSRRTSGKGVFAALLIASGLAVAVSAFVFQSWTDGLGYLAASGQFGGYVAEVLALALVVVLVPGTLLGTIFPFVLKLAANRDSPPGATVGALAALNTAGAVSGSLATGFLLLPSLGLPRSLQLAAAAYVVLAAVLRPRTGVLAAAGLAALLLIGPLDVREMRRVDSDPASEVVVAVEDSAEGTVAVVRRGDVVAIRLNNSYTVGTNANITNDRRKADLPLMLVPAPSSVLLIGMGAGVTAAAALDHPVERVTTCELVPAVAGAARQYLAERTRKLFEDPRSRVVYGDGRTFLAATDESFDVIIGDLFVPWHAGVGNLYTVEHFRSAYRHLTANGVFAQWLPLHQFTRSELGIVVRTMLEAFPLVTLWRGDLLPNAPTVALIGHRSDAPLDLGVVLDNVRRRIGDHGAADEVSEALMLLFYAGNLTQSRRLFADAPVNSADQPVIEYLAPISQRRVHAGKEFWLTGERLVAYYRWLWSVAPPEEDEYLRRLSDRQRGYARGGLNAYETFVYRAAGEDAVARDHFRAFTDFVPPQVAEMFEAMLQG